MDNLAHDNCERCKIDIELQLYTEKKRRQREAAQKKYIREQRLWGTVLIAVSILLFPLYKEVMMLCFCVILGLIPWIPDDRR